MRIDNVSLIGYDGYMVAQLTCTAEQKEIPEDIFTGGYSLEFKKINSNEAEKAFDNSVNLAVSNILAQVGYSISCRELISISNEKLKAPVTQKLLEKGFIVSFTSYPKEIIVEW